MSAPAPGIAGWFRSLPDGVLLKHAFFGLAGVAAVVLALDFRSLANEPGAGMPLMPALQPVRMDRPTPDDQVRPYLPYARPAAPGSAPGRERRREESEAADMRFRLGTHGAAFAEGIISPGAAEAFAAFLAEERTAEVTEIVLHSPGGSVADAVAMARLIREKGLATRILPDGYCASSCPLVFAGGKLRIADATAWIGVHQAFALPGEMGSLSDGMAEAQRLSAEVQDLLHDFGVDPRVWTRAMATPSESLYLFTPAELAELKLATSVEGKTPPAGS